MAESIELRNILTHILIRSSKRTHTQSHYWGVTISFLMCFIFFFIKYKATIGSDTYTHTHGFHGLPARLRAKFRRHSDRVVLLFQVAGSKTAVFLYFDHIGLHFQSIESKLESWASDLVASKWLASVLCWHWWGGNARHLADYLLGSFIHETELEVWSAYFDNVLRM